MMLRENKVDKRSPQPQVFSDLLLQELLSLLFWSRFFPGNIISAWDHKVQNV